VMRLPPTAAARDGRKLDFVPEQREGEGDSFPRGR